MRPIEEVYPDAVKPTDPSLAEDWCWYGETNYKPLLESIADIVVQVDDKDYQGDSRVLFKRGDDYGVLIFGWGSCSGCDALMACSDLHAIGELRDQLANRVVWRSKADTLAWLTSNDRELEFVYYTGSRDEDDKILAATEWVDFVRKCVEELSNAHT